MCKHVGYEPDLKVKIVCRQLMDIRGIEATAVMDRVTKQDNYLLAILERGIVNDYYMVRVTYLGIRVLLITVSLYRRMVLIPVSLTISLVFLKIVRTKQ